MLSEIKGELLGQSHKSVALATKVTEIMKEESFGTLLKNLGLPSFLSFLRGTMNLRYSIPTNNDEQICIKAKLSVAMYEHLCQAYPRIMRKHLKAHVESRGMTDAVDPTVIISCLSSLLLDFPRFDKKSVLNTSSDCNTTLLRTCLKHGVAAVEMGNIDPEISASCLRLSRQIVVAFSASSLSRTLPPISEIFAMVVSHSQFIASILECFKDEKLGAPKLELVRLLLACVSLAPAAIDLPSPVWATLLAGYDAGVGETDRSLRRLFSIVIERNPEVSFTLLASAYFSETKQANNYTTHYCISK